MGSDAGGGTSPRSGDSVERFLSERSFLRAVVSRLPIILWRVDPDGTFTHSVGQGLRRLGLADGQAVGRNAFEDYAQAEPSIRRALAGEPVAFETQGGTEERPWSYLTFCCPDEVAGEGVVGFSIDVTEAKRSEEALRQSERLFRELTSHVHDMFWMADGRAKRLLHVSPAFERFFGRAPRDMEDAYRTWKASLHPDDRERVLAALRELPSSDSFHERYRVVREDGTELWLRDRGFCIRDESGRVVRLAGLAEDVTEKVRASREREELERQLVDAQRLESLAVLSGGIAHDFNNLLVGIMTGVDEALQALPEDSSARRCLEIAERSARRAADLTRQLLVHAGRSRPELRAVDLDEVVRDTAELVHGSLPMGVGVRIEPHGELPPVHGDPAQLGQVVMNLLLNAGEAMRACGGTLIVRTGVEELGETEARSASFVAAELTAGLHVCLEVEDQGVGMDAETAARVFEPFFSTRSSGRGLGLATVRGLVRSHGGGIGVESAPGRGTVMRVLLPVAAAAAREDVDAAPSAAVERWRGAGIALVADDEEAVRRLVSRILERNGFSVITARDGDEAEAVVAERSGDLSLAVLDLTMPGRDGGDVLARIRQTRPGLPVIVCSGYDARRLADRLDGDAGAAFLQKPFRGAELVATVQRLMNA